MHTQIQIHSLQRFNDFFYLLSFVILINIKIAVNLISGSNMSAIQLKIPNLSSIRLEVEPKTDKINQIDQAAAKLTQAQSNTNDDENAEKSHIAQILQFESEDGACIKTNEKPD